eukprot:CAMPEP_0175143562 /NCGR_PEP_ID=MMETSP0087-20121206/13522_1 /TAXON_ID=136419 /ORGANISM="Unknown Unknown, Strain D1" /LENGTH=210 /DNA_ID=CAMNT_0016427687 /DNA_START=9 /DNA_END=641 /DNA_ORIENTATION=+
MPQQPGFGGANAVFPAAAGQGTAAGRMVFSEGGFGFPSEVFPGGSDHITNCPSNLYCARAAEEMSHNGTGSPKWVMMRNATHKLVYRAFGVSELYDFTTDPRELVNQFDNPVFSALRNEMMGQLMQWLVQTGDLPVLRQDARGPPAKPNTIDQATCDNLLQPDPSHSPTSYTHPHQPDQPNHANSDSHPLLPSDLLEINGVNVVFEQETE